jgi:hypothetical protein
MTRTHTHDEMLVGLIIIIIRSVITLTNTTSVTTLHTNIQCLKLFACRYRNTYESLACTLVYLTDLFLQVPRLHCSLQHV